MISTAKPDTSDASRQPYVSVCIPTFNSEQYVVQAIESILNQSFRNFEVIIADDGSSDSTLNLCKQFATADNRVILSGPQTHCGLFRNYNRAMSLARGKYIKLLAHDDLLDPDALSKMVTVLDQNDGVAVVGCSRRLIDETGNTIGTATAFEHSGNVSGSEAITEALLKLDNHIGDPTSMMFRRTLVNEGFSEQYVYLNLEFWCRLFMQGGYYHLSEILCSQRQHDAQRGNVLLQSLLYLSDYLQLIEDCEKSILPATQISVDEWLKRVDQVMLDHVNFRLAQPTITSELCRRAADELIERASVEEAKTYFSAYARLTHWLFLQMVNCQQKSHQLQSYLNSQLDEIAWLRARVEEQSQQPSLNSSTSRSFDRPDEKDCVATTFSLPDKLRRFFGIIK